MKLTSSSLLAVFTESIDCDNWWDCMGFCPIWPTWSILLLFGVGVAVDGDNVTGEIELLGDVDATGFEIWPEATDVGLII